MKGFFKRLFFILYLGLLFQIILLKGASLSQLFTTTESLKTINLEPLATVKLFLRAFPALSWKAILYNLLGNVLIFMPIGFLLASSKRYGKIAFVVLVGMLWSLFLEGLQLISGLGYFDVDDLLLNTLGTLLGWILYRILFRRQAHEDHYL